MLSSTNQDIIYFVDNPVDNKKINEILRFMQAQQRPVSLSEVRNFVQTKFDMGKMWTRKSVHLLEEKKCIKINRNSNGHAWQIQATEEPSRYKFVSEFTEKQLLLLEAEVSRLRTRSKKGKFTLKEFFDILDLRNEISQLPWKRYQSGVILAEGIGMELMQKTANKCDTLNKTLQLVCREQEKYQLQTEEILKLLASIEKLARYQIFPEIDPSKHDRKYYANSIKRGINISRSLGVGAGL